MTKMRQWSILTVVAVIVVFAAGWFMLVKPQKSKASDLRTQAATQESQNQVLLSQIAALQAEEKSLPQQQAALRKFSTQVPDNAAEPTIIRQLSAAANGAGVDLVSMTPGASSPVVATTDTTGATVPAAGSTSLGAPAAGGTLLQLPVAIGITGSFPNIESFFQSLEKLPRALLVTGWSLCPQVPAAQGSSASASTGANCTPPSLPADKTPPAGTLGGTLSATIFYAPPAGTSVATGSTSLTPPATTGTTPTTATTGTTTGTTGTTPATTTSTAPVTPATGATTAPAN